MDLIKNGWFSEISAFWPGQCFSVEVEEVLFQTRSDYQDIVVFKSKTWGNVLVLDGVIQATERDEFAYQEAITHIPLFSHPNPRNVLVVGGGDGGVLREVVKHAEVEEVTLCEIDNEVIKASKKYMREMAVGFNDPRVKVHVGDGLEFIRKSQKKYDVIITDSSDPIGPAEGLFGKEYYELLKSSLAPGGVVCSQAESIWLHLDTVKQLVQFTKNIFPIVSYAYATVPSYPGGSIGFLICSEHPTQKPVRDCSKISAQLKYYDDKVHEAAFVLPAFAKRAIE